MKVTTNDIWRLYVNALSEEIGSDGERGYIALRVDRLLRVDQVKDMVGLGKTFIYKLVQSGQFPAPYKPGGSVSRWSENEIMDWLAKCATERRQ